MAGFEEIEVGSYSVEESRDRIVANNMALAMRIAGELFASQRKRFRSLGVEASDIEAEASVLMLEIVDEWDRDCPFDSFCEPELRRRLRGRIRVLTGADRKHRETQSSVDFPEADRVDDKASYAVDEFEAWDLVESRLTETEALVVRKRDEGFTDSDIADQIGVHRSTVASLFQSIQAKLGGEFDE